MNAIAEQKSTFDFSRKPWDTALKRFPGKTIRIRITNETRRARALSSLPSAHPDELLERYWTAVGQKDYWLAGDFSKQISLSGCRWLGRNDFWNPILKNLKDGQIINAMELASAVRSGVAASFWPPRELTLFLVDAAVSNVNEKIKDPVKLDYSNQALEIDRWNKYFDLVLLLYGPFKSQLIEQYLEEFQRWLDHPPKVNPKHRKAIIEDLCKARRYLDERSARQALWRAPIYLKTAPDFSAKFWQWRFDRTWKR